MIHRVAAFSRQIVSKRKSPKVADETMFAIPNQDIAVYAHDINRGGGATRQHRSKGFLVISIIARVSFSFLSCFSHHRAHGIRGADGLWVTGELGRTAEIDHLMVSDSMRYAILM